MPSRSTFALAFVALLACACGSESASPALAGHIDNNVLQRTARLEALIEGAAATPSISWRSTGLPLVVAGFFARGIDVQQNLIVNTTDLVWVWHTGLGRGREGNVAWGDGAPVRFGEPRTDVAPGPLSRGRYYWAVWALDARGEPQSSTIEFTHDVE